MPLLRTSLILFFLGFLSLARAQEFRTFNLTDGRTIDARIIEITDGKIVLQRADKLTFKLPVEAFSKNDLAVIREWQLADMQEKGTLIKLAGNSATADLQRQPEDGLVLFTWWHVYKVTVTNQSPYELADLEIAYTFTRTPAKLAQAKPKAETETPQPLPQSERKKFTLPAGEHFTLSNSSQLRRTELEPGWTWPDGGNAPLSDTLSPLTATVTFKGEIIATLTIEPTAPDFSKAKDKTSTAPTEAEQ
ncbi:hypothetical protein H5P28_12480 [Ruficoccus amylovorans]|uniref:Uncharacterized protein n=1 Tax=Ruficoccus amylovorans TaxID=1804625 RepID=A0A842HEQ5_9BACT|nr:hypothetical protein [Ruficoccus amylovorans]MBC2595075.1 hypothetical protein [Ruficoccus amylovorans]